MRAKTTQAVLDRCMTHGFASAGVCAARATAYAAQFRTWVSAGSHGTMQYLQSDLEERLDPEQLVPGARSIICVADRYATGAPDARRPGRGRIARYARGEDYHEVIRARLDALAEELRTAHPSHRFRVCVDTAPLLEREHAARAGLGRIGKHTLLIGPHGQGSWLVLGAIVCTLELAPTAFDGSVGDSRHRSVDPCGACTRCIDACPTHAITPWSVDAQRCISYLTIEHRGDVQPTLAPLVQDWIFGCDICQEVCPHNQPTRRSKALPVHAAYQPFHDGFDLLAVLGWTEADWCNARMHGALRRADRSMWVRNAALAARCALRESRTGLALNHAEAKGLRNRLAALAADAAEPREVRQAASLALGSMQARPNA